MRKENLLLAAILIVTPTVATARPAARAASRCALAVEGAVGTYARRLVHCRLRGGRGGAGADSAGCLQRARTGLDSALQKLAGRCAGDCSLAAAVPVADSVNGLLAEADERLQCVISGGQARVLSMPIAGPPQCGGPGLDSPAAPPFSGEVQTADGTSLGDLTLGCVYLGGGQAPAAAPAGYYSSGPALLDVVPTADPDRVKLVGSAGDGPLGCTHGGSSAHCLVFGQPSRSCTTDADCGNVAGACQPDARCFTTPPLDVEAGGAGVCLVNIVREDGSGTLDTVTGSGTFSMPLSTRVYVMGGPGAGCPRCDEGRCDSGKSVGGACRTSGTATTSTDCLPRDDQFFGSIDMTMVSTTETATLSADAAGVFCPGQSSPGAFALPTARTIVQQGTPAGDLRDGLPHEATMAISTCIPPSANAIITAQGGLPYPLAVASRSLIHLQPAP